MAVASAVAAAIAFACAVAQADVSGPQIVAYVNAQRAAQGLPAGIVEDPALSDGCAKHNAYGLATGLLVHAEDPAQAAYSVAGDQAARSSILYEATGPWTAVHDPFETAPIHLHQLLAPRLDRMGASENQGYGCATTLASRNRPAPGADVTYTYPGDRATRWLQAQVAAEEPYTPGERVGIPAGSTTGPYLYVMFDGPDLTPFDSAAATSSSLTGPDGPVAIATVDNHTPGLESYLPPGMEVIPRAPLRVDATYTAHVSANVSTNGGAGPSRAFSHTWSFSTGPTIDAATASSVVAGADSEPPAVVITKPRNAQRIRTFTRRIVKVNRGGVTRRIRRLTRTPIRFAGVATDATGMQGVFITVEQLRSAKSRVGRRRLPAARRCRWLDPKHGVRPGRCDRPVIIQARLASSGLWTYQVPRALKLSKGAYRVIAYGLDTAHVNGNSASRADRSVRFTMK